MISQNYQQNLQEQIIAIIYSTVWALQSVIQIYRNYKIKTMEGMSIDFLVLALNANIFYAIYSLAGYLGYPGTGTVLLGDILYPLLTVFLTSIQGIQFLIYPRGYNVVSGKTFIIVLLCWSFILINMLFTEILGIFPQNQYWNVLSIMGYCKLLISFIKYAPAVYWNYRMKTTKGWPTLKVILDIIGGVLSLLSGSVSTEDGINITKLCLAILTLLYDFIFLGQRYRYKQSKGNLQHGVFEEQKSLIDKSNDDLKK